jgi:hypothetical protein
VQNLQPRGGGGSCEEGAAMLLYIQLFVLIELSPLYTVFLMIWNLTWIREGENNEIWNKGSQIQFLHGTPKFSPPVLMVTMRKFIDTHISDKFDVGRT